MFGKNKDDNNISEEKTTPILKDKTSEKDSSGVLGFLGIGGPHKEFDYEPEKKDKGIRHNESLLDDMEDIIKDNTIYGEEQDLKKEWNLQKKDFGLERKPKNNIIALIFAIAAFAMIILGVFIILPNVLPGMFKGSNIELFAEKEVKLVYDERYRVVMSVAENIMTEPNIASERITQVLYNDVVEVISKTPIQGTDGNYYLYVSTSDGIKGYINSRNLTENLDSVEPDLHAYKIVISDTVKNVMTHATNGTLITKVMMNTVLYADVKRDGVYQVCLPNGDMGWVGSSGVIELDVRGTIEEVSTRYFVSSALTFANATYLNNGVTMNGISVNGLVYVCANVNGVKAPRTIEGLMELGTEVELQYDVVTGELVIDSIMPGDLVFLRATANSGDEVTEMAICTDTGTLLMLSKARTTIRLRNFTSSDNICERIVMVRRVFSA
ncbi:MAG: SH3 domain-containing protein [Clostridia bacterium]|nr:SH3 domain-containing protein [Clostridia bacterium]